MNVKAFVAVAGLAMAAAAPAGAQLVQEANLSANAALTIAQTAYNSCGQQGYKVSVHVVGREGQVLAAVRGDGTGPHTFENSLRKAYTARTFRVPSGDFAQRIKDNPTSGAVHLANVVAAQGALPIKAGDEVIGGVGVSGAPGGDKDEVCAKAGIDKVFGAK
ncbi:MAG: heme-binding protein [Magnetospirillum sp.]|nr:heme-binding protein [Magnetospirillum sp.]